jgi:hypothetical protein
MATTTLRMALNKHSLADSFRLIDYTQNWDKLDSYPGIFICTSTTRPSTWGAPQTGQSIRETDSKLTWVWNGSAFERGGPRGKLGATPRTADIATTSANYVIAVQTSVVIPAGGRDVLVIAEIPKADSTAGVVALALVRDSTLLTEWRTTGDTSVTPAMQPKGAPFTCRDQAPLAGAHAYALQFAAPSGFAGTATLRAAVTSPIQITVIEI